MQDTTSMLNDTLGYRTGSDMSFGFVQDALYHTAGLFPELDNDSDVPFLAWDTLLQGTSQNTENTF